MLLRGGGGGGGFRPHVENVLNRPGEIGLKDLCHLPDW